MILDFEKFDDGRWYVVLPEWTGDQEDLEMVDGADKLLDNVTQDGFTARMEFYFDEEPAKSDDYVKCDLIDHNDWGGTYKPKPNQFYNDTFWLCNVTHYVCGEHPEVLWIKNLS